MQSKSGLAWLWLSAVTLIVDLATKYIAVQTLPYEGYSINILPIFNFTLAYNHGAAFSFLADHAGWQKYFFIGLAIIISGVLIHFLWKNRYSQKLANAAYALIIGGAIGNAIDRAYNGYVIDFLHFYWDIYHYPVFNIADIGIVVGAGLLILETLLESRREKQAKLNQK